jgi:hypothetical protein
MQGCFPKITKQTHDGGSLSLFHWPIFPAQIPNISAIISPDQDFVSSPGDLSKKGSLCGKIYDQQNRIVN